MPEKLHRCVNKVQAKGKSKSSSWAICTAGLKKKRKSKKYGN